MREGVSTVIACAASALALVEWVAANNIEWPMFRAIGNPVGTGRIWSSH
jgi:hypothetical protein